MSNPDTHIQNTYLCDSNVCEIYLSRSKWINANIRRDDKDDVTLANDIFNYLEGEFGYIPQNQRHIKENLLYQYWQSIKRMYVNDTGKQYLMQAFQNLIKCSAQNTTTVSNRLQSKVKRSISMEVNRPDHDEFVLETSKVYRLLMDCTKRLEVIETDAENNTAIGDRGRLLSQVLQYKRVKHSEVPVDFDINTIGSEYTEKRKTIFEEFKELSKDLKNNLNLLYVCINNWKESHKMAYIKCGHQYNTIILKDGCTEACKLILKMIALLNKDHFQRMASLPDITDNPLIDNIPKINEQIEKQLITNFKELFMRCFVVEIEPTDVQKVTGSSDKGSKKGKVKSEGGAKDKEVKSNKCGPEFNVSVTVLCGRGLECISTVMKPVKAKLYYEENQAGKGRVSGELSVAQVSVDKDGIAEFRKQKIINFERPEKTNKSEQVTSERYRIVFETDLSIQNPNITIELKTMSLPMAIITGSNQANQAHGALLWYCYNTNPYILPSFPVTVPRPKFVEMIQACFKYLDGRLLRDDEINFLLAKLFKQENVMRNEVKYEEFEGSHKPKEDKTIAFWRWLQSILNLIEFFLLKPWQDRVIHGFVSRQQTDDLLYDEPEGVFLLRFSESMVIGDGQNRNLTGALVAAFSRGAGSKPILSRPLTVDSYFKKYSLFAVLSGIQNEEKGRQLLKKLYGSQTTINDFKTLYHHKKTEKKDTEAQCTTYPNWNEQTLLMLSKMDLDENDDDDDDDDNDDNDDEGDGSVSEALTRKKPKLRQDSMNSSVYSPETPSSPNQQPETSLLDAITLTTLPPNAVDNLLALNNFPHSGASTSAFINTFTTVSSTTTSEFQNTMLLPDGTLIGSMDICSTEHLNQQAIGQVVSPIANTLISSSAIGPVNREIQSPDNTSTQMDFDSQFDTTWSPVTDSIPTTAQEFMNLSGPDHIEDFST